MVFGRQYWIWIWYGIFVLGVLGLFASVYWGRRTHFKNLEEIYRAIGTILVSLGMVFLLRQIWTLFGQVLLLMALAFFIFAFVAGRRAEAERGEHRVEDQEEL
jgi:Ca2+/Na+ antiporter